jgi:plastocyanin
MRLRLTIACAAALAAAAAAPSSALALERIDAVFAAEFSAPEYTIDEGEIALFTNRDAFFQHGVVSDAGNGSLFSAPVVPKAGQRLVRGAPYLTSAGTPYEFHCPIHPGMTAVLHVNSNGTPLPPDSVAPGAAVKIKGKNRSKVGGKRRLKLTVNPIEPVDVVATAGIKGLALGRAERTYLGPGPRTITMRLTKPGGRAIRAMRRGGKIKVKVTLTDLAGNVGVVKAAKALG